MIRITRIRIHHTADRITSGKRYRLHNADRQEIYIQYVKFSNNASCMGIRYRTSYVGRRDNSHHLDILVIRAVQDLYRLFTEKICILFIFCQRKVRISCHNKKCRQEHGNTRTVFKCPELGVVSGVTCFYGTICSSASTHLYDAFFGPVTLGLRTVL